LQENDIFTARNLQAKIAVLQVRGHLFCKICLQILQDISIFLGCHSSVQGQGSSLSSASRLAWPLKFAQLARRCMTVDLNNNEIWLANGGTAGEQFVK